jgi:hypothetical protein
MIENNSFNMAVEYNSQINFESPGFWEWNHFVLYSVWRIIFKTYASSSVLPFRLAILNLHILALKWTVLRWINLRWIILDSASCIFKVYFENYLPYHLSVVQFVSVHPNSNKPDTTWTQYWLCQVCLFVCFFLNLVIDR